MQTEEFKKNREANNEYIKNFINSFNREGLDKKTICGMLMSNMGMTYLYAKQKWESAKGLPPIYRFGTGDATDSTGNKSGQLDVVVEYPFSPSLPVVGTGQSRLYLAEITHVGWLLGGQEAIYTL